MARYATAAQLLERLDARTVQQLVSDDGAMVSRQDLASDTVLQTALDDASGAIDSALRVGKRYTTDQLEKLSGNAAHYLQRVTCELAIGFLLERRPGLNTKLLETYHERGQLYLNRLKRGEDVFNIDAKINKTLPTLGGPSAVDYGRMNLLPDRTNHYYPGRANRLPTDRT